jgi:hypothetical protein
MGVDVGAYRSLGDRLRRWERWTVHRPRSEESVKIHRYLFDQLMADVSEAAATITHLETELKLYRKQEARPPALRAEKREALPRSQASRR